MILVILIAIIMVLIGIIIGVFMNRIIPTKQEKIEKEYVKIFKEAVEKDLEQNNVKKKNWNKISRIDIN